MVCMVIHGGTPEVRGCSAFAVVCGACAVETRAFGRAWTRGRAARRRRRVSCRVVCQASLVSRDERQREPASCRPHAHM